jgi:hypothetical protein
VAFFEMRQQSYSSIVSRTAIRLLVDAVRFARSAFDRGYGSVGWNPCRFDEATRITPMVLSPVIDWSAALTIVRHLAGRQLTHGKAAAHSECDHVSSSRFSPHDDTLAGFCNAGQYLQIWPCVRIAAGGDRMRVNLKRSVIESFAAAS